MEHTARTLIFLEMLFINLVTSHYCSRKKYPLGKIIAVMTLFTGVVLALLFLVRHKLNIPYFDGGILILLGLTYFFPLKYLYSETAKRIIAIMFFSWIHTLTVTFFSLQLSVLLEFKNHFAAALIIQTVIYLFTAPAVIRYVKNKFLYILKNIPEEMDKYFVGLALVDFAVLFIIQLCIQTNQFWWKMTAGLLVILIAALSYHLIYITVKTFKSINFLEQLAYSDPLTGVNNRLALFLDCEKLISENIPFTFIYMDLDNFKKVNDTYGHSVGDNYLKQFTQAIMTIVGDRGKIYRMAGDEFTCVYVGQEADLLLQTFEQKIIRLFLLEIPFLGVSIGHTKFPEDGDSLDELINKADRTMYKFKSS